MQILFSILTLLILILNIYYIDFNILGGAMKPVKNISDVEAEVKKSLVILKSMPSDGPRKVTSHWPAYLHENFEKSADGRVIRYTKALPEEIDDMDEVLGDWLKCLSYDERNLVISRCSGYSWKILSNKFDLSRSALYAKYKFYLKKILRHVLKRQNENNKGEK